MNVGDAIRGIRNQIKSILGAITELQELADSSASHDLLSAVHSDTEPDSPVSGDIIIADATPEWIRLPKDTNGKVLELVAGLPAWATCPITAHDLLSTSHGDTTAAAVQRGDLVVGKNASPKWERFGKGTIGQVLMSDGTDLYWGDIAAGGGSFTDNFADASRHWGWYDHQTDANKTIVESGGVLTIAVAAGTTSDWWSSINTCPKAVTGGVGFPCTLIAKLNNFTVNNKCIAGVFVASDALGYGADYAVYFGRGRDDGGGRNGLILEALGTALDYDAETTLPIWLKVTITGDSGGSKMVFSYSTDGNSYTETYTYTNIARAAGLVMGLFAKNWDGAAISAPFEFFTLTANAGPG